MGTSPPPHTSSKTEYVGIVFRDVINHTQVHINAVQKNFLPDFISVPSNRSSLFISSFEVKISHQQKGKSSYETVEATITRGTHACCE